MEGKIDSNSDEDIVLEKKRRKLKGKKSKGELGAIG